MQYQRDVRIDCSRFVYHMLVLGAMLDKSENHFAMETYMMMKEGCTQDSKTPRRNRTTMSEAKFLAAAEQAMTQPQQKTLTARYFATGSFWRRRLVGYSPTRTPM
jgi:hypothetical protein